MKKNIIFNIFKNLVIFFCIIYLFHEVYKNFNYIEKKFIEYKSIFLLIILVKIVNQNIVSLRNFTIYRICAKYAGKFIDWSQIFFESLIFNVLISHTGSIYRAIETKKRGLEYKKYIGIFYVLFTSYVLVNTMMVITELMFLKEVSLQFKINLFFIFILLFFTTIYTPKILNIFIKFNFFKKNFYRYKIFKKIIQTYELIFLFIKTQTFLKKNNFLFVDLWFSYSFYRTLHFLYFLTNNSTRYTYKYSFNIIWVKFYFRQNTFNFQCSWYQ